MLRAPATQDRGGASALVTCRAMSGWKPCLTPHSTACDRLDTPILR